MSTTFFIGAVTACSFIPLVIFSLFGGVIADRKNKRNIIVALDFSTAAVILLFSLALGKISLVPLMIAVLMILYGISGIYQPAVQASIPLITDQEMLVQILGMSDTALGITQGAMGLGGLAGGMIAGAAAKKMRLKNGYVILIICSLAAFFMGISVFEAVPKIIGYAIITAVSFGAMCASTMFSVSMMTAVQKQTPPHLLGKIMAVIIAVSSCSQPVGQAVYGVLFDVFLDKPYVLMMGTTFLAVGVSLYSKKIFAALEKESEAK